MAEALPLFLRTELDAVKAKREELLKRLQKVRMDAHSRIRTQQKVALLTAEQMRLEAALYGRARP
ncbi:hypothetical protein AX761_21950 [Rhizobium sp. 58]|nr:hypothetical protein AX761_21950 [Rhizobium sp. 58]